MDSVKSETYLQNINKNQNTIHPPIKKKNPQIVTSLNCICTPPPPLKKFTICITM